MSNRTIIDILNRGDLELFHSSMLAWLLDPEGEHKLGDLFLRKLAQLLDDKGHPFLNIQLSKGWSRLDIETEHRIKRCIFDIALLFRGDTSANTTIVVIENKLKSIGQVKQLCKYMDLVRYVIPVGFTEASFAPNVNNDFPIILYQDIVDALIGIQFPDNEFGMLLEQYLRYIKRELKVFHDINQALLSHEGLTHSKLLSAVDNSTPEDKRRYLNLYIIEMFRRKYGSRMALRNWASNKNEISGVWLSSYPVSDSGLGYRFRDDIDEINRNYNITEDKSMKSRLWFHIELFANALTPHEDVSKDRMIGTIHIRSKERADKKNKEFARSFRDKWKHKTTCRQMNLPKDTAKSFGLFKEDLVASDLSYEGLLIRLERFMSYFGTSQ